METQGLIEKQNSGNPNAKGRMNVFDANNITTEFLEKKIDEYFEEGANEKTYYVVNNGKTVEKKVKLFTFTGLVLFLGFCSRDSWFDMEKKPQNVYSNLLKKARTRIEQYYEELCQTSNPVGAIFIMKNLGYTDQTTINQNINEIPRPEIVPADHESGKMVKVMFNQEQKTGS